MPLTFIRNDIARAEADAIVLPANEYLRKGPGASSAIFEAAGEAELEKACTVIGYLPMGKSAVTEGFNLNAEYIIHTVVPLWQGGSCGEEGYLRAAYRNSLAKAKELKIESIAFPLLSAGNFGYPKSEALRIAADEITSFLEENEMDVYMVIYGEKDLKAAYEIQPDIIEYIDSNYVEKQMKHSYGSRRERRYQRSGPVLAGRGLYSSFEPQMCESCSIEDIKCKEEKSFSEKLLELIDRKGMTDPMAYHASNIDRKLFNKIKNSKGYTPKKNTVLSFCLGLRLNLREAEDLLNRAGYSLSPCIKFDLAVKYFLETGNYNDIHDVNIALFEMFEMSL